MVEAYAYKNNYSYTKMQRVAGVGGQSSQRAMDMYMKYQYINVMRRLEGLQKQFEAAKVEAEKPFTEEEKLSELLKEQVSLNLALEFADEEESETAGTQKPGRDHSYSIYRKLQRLARKSTTLPTIIRKAGIEYVTRKSHSCWIPQAGPFTSCPMGKTLVVNFDTLKPEYRSDPTSYGLPQAALGAAPRQGEESFCHQSLFY